MALAFNGTANQVEEGSVGGARKGERRREGIREKKEGRNEGGGKNARGT